ncbi:LysE family translocator [Pelagibius marinus]|uniref:LysE family translocator n=1 Tax=Pelagibius marinus TaxID=2762760 RepID=UPI002AC32C2F|nr:LysE family translocator [Pelagibius marinus]
MSPELSPEFLITSLIVVIAPGTGVIYTLANGLSLGARASVIAALGCTLGIVPHIAASILGLAAVVHASALAFQLLKYAGVAYLLYLAWSAWRESGALPLPDQARAQEVSRRAGRILGRGITVNLLNPKLSIFFLAFLPQFVDAAAGGLAWQMAGLGLVFMGLTLVVFIGYGLLAAVARRQVVERPSVMTLLRRGFALALAGLGLRLAFAER